MLVFFVVLAERGHRASPVNRVVTDCARWSISGKDFTCCSPRTNEPPSFQSICNEHGTERAHSAPIPSTANSSNVSRAASTAGWVSQRVSLNPWAMKTLPPCPPPPRLQCAAALNSWHVRKSRCPSCFARHHVVGCSIVMRFLPHGIATTCSTTAYCITLQRLLEHPCLRTHAYNNTA